jgi:predicted nucleic acid-binding protein
MKQTTMSDIALDTNVLIYSHLKNDEHKRAVAHELLTYCPIVSTQVVSEYLNVMKRLLFISKIELLELCAQWMNECRIQIVERSTVNIAKQIVQRYDFQLFDAIIVASALEAGCKILYSEDMQHNMKNDRQLTIINPFI